MERITVSVREAGRLLSLGNTKIYELINAGLLKRIKVGRKSLITAESIAAFIRRCDGEAS